MYKVGSLYAGIGGIDLGFKQAGFEILWANEIDSNATKTYKANFSHTLYEEDIFKLDPSKLEKVDILTAGFPCQPFSVAGYQKGFNDERGNHFFRVLYFVDTLEPKIVFLENVKNLESHNNGDTFKVICNELKKRKYNVFHKILNSKNFGVPQNRERVFIIALKDNKTFNFPDGVDLSYDIQDYLDDNVDKTFLYGTEKPMFDILAKEITNNKTVYQWRRQYVRENKSGVCPTLTANMGTGGHNVPLVLSSQGIRKLTPRECFRFQGFPESYKLPALANSHLYKQAGNSVSVSVIYNLALKLKSLIENQYENKDQELINF